MIDRREPDVVKIPIEQIGVVNPRTRSKHKFQQIVASISSLGLKKPVTVVQRGTRDGKPFYELVCGQGRLEACRLLGEASVPALVVRASREELLLMSLAENLARRRHTCVEMLREVESLKERGYTYRQIAQKTDLSLSFVKGIMRLLKKGEHRLLEAVERGDVRPCLGGHGGGSPNPTAVGQAGHELQALGLDFWHAKRCAQSLRAHRPPTALPGASEQRPDEPVGPPSLLGRAEAETLVPLPPSGPPFPTLPA